MPAIPLSEALPGMTVALEDEDVVLSALLVMVVAPVSGSEEATVRTCASDGLTSVTEIGMLDIALTAARGRLRSEPIGEDD